LTVTCSQCHIQRYWLPAAGRLDRHAVLATVIEPVPRGTRKHVTGDHDPARGRLHRPEHLQLCLACGQLRGPHEAFDNLCQCDRQAWDRDPAPRCGDLFTNAGLCKSCVTTLIEGCSRWSAYHCRECLPAVHRWRRMAGWSIVPIGPHSLMNGIGAKLHEKGLSDAQVIALSDQLSGLFTAQDSLHELAARRARKAAHELGFDGHAVAANEFLAARRAAGSTSRSGFFELVASHSRHDSTELAEHIWTVAASDHRGASHGTRSTGTL